MPSLIFVTPAWQRFDVTKVCAEQRAWACEKLAAAGIVASAVYVAADENLDTARGLGFATVERENDYLGAKFNDGYQYAAALGADYVCPIGSDSWVDPGFIIRNLPDPAERVVVYSRHYAVIRPDGRRRAQLLVVYDGGTTMFYPTATLASSGYRPIGETLMRGCDGSTIASIKAGGDTEFRIAEVHEFETLSFQTELQVTNYDKLIERWGVGETDKPFAGLDEFYPPKLLARMRRIYAKRADR